MKKPDRKNCNQQKYRLFETGGRRMVPTEDTDMENYKSKMGRPEQEVLEQDFRSG